MESEVQPRPRDLSAIMHLKRGPTSTGYLCRSCCFSRTHIRHSYVSTLLLPYTSTVPGRRRGVGIPSIGEGTRAETAATTRNCISWVDVLMVYRDSGSIDRYQETSTLYDSSVTDGMVGIFAMARNAAALSSPVALTSSAKMLPVLSNNSNGGPNSAA